MLLNTFFLQFFHLSFFDAFDFDASNYNSDYIQYGVNSLKLAGPHLRCK